MEALADERLAEGRRGLAESYAGGGEGGGVEEAEGATWSGHGDILRWLCALFRRYGVRIPTSDGLQCCLLGRREILMSPHCAASASVVTVLNHGVEMSTRTHTSHTSPGLFEHHRGSIESAPPPVPPQTPAAYTMSGKYIFTKSLKEVRFHLCQSSEHSAAVRYNLPPSEPALPVFCDIETDLWPLQRTPNV